MNGFYKQQTAIGICGMLLNLLLACAKLTAGFLLGLVSVVADGFNNLSDLGGGVVLTVSAHIAGKPADKEHPYGHQRAEYVASLIIGCLILMICFELLVDSVGKCISGNVVPTEWWLYPVLGISVVVKAFMAGMYAIAAKKYASSSLRASAKDSLCDVVATLAVMLGAMLTTLFSVPADGYAGLAVGVFILFEGAGILKDAGSSLLGRAPDPELISAIRKTVLGGEGVLGLHDLRVYRFGPNKFIATAHIETDASLSAAYAHTCVEAVEKTVEREHGVVLTAHCDPVVLNDEEAVETETKIRSAVTGMYEGMELHDFRLVRGKQNKIVFEIGVPFDCKTADSEIENTVVSAVRVLCGIDAAVTVDRE